ncbi:unnamed protein product [Schistosoma mattheei]|uniref:Uncharacterized protein n=1 Tax=Schistosoma mattheei TaxID=31246 RepID=A0A3P7ZSI0_9TREM|nr:unnamed protein product [Schistosoma mattheei]
MNSPKDQKNFLDRKLGEKWLHNGSLYSLGLQVETYKSPIDNKQLTNKISDTVFDSDCSKSAYIGDLGLEFADMLEEVLSYEDGSCCSTALFVNISEGDSLVSECPVDLNFSRFFISLKSSFPEVIKNICW